MLNMVIVLVTVYFLLAIYGLVDFIKSANRFFSDNPSYPELNNKLVELFETICFFCSLPIIVFVAGVLCFILLVIITFDYLVNYKNNVEFRRAA